MDLHIPHQKRVLLSPLYWGMGHTTRLMPIIRDFIQQDNTVWIAGNESQISFYKKNLPDCVSYLLLDSPQIRYGSTRRATRWRLMQQIPRWQDSLKTDHKKLAKWQAELDLNWVVSDARLGLHHPDVHSVLINHQIQPRSGAGRIADHLLRVNSEKLMRPFDEVWVPDREENPLAGTLSQIPRHHHKYKYIGWLSHLEQLDYQPEIDYLFILSGPQPLRDAFEHFAADFLASTGHTGYYVGGSVSEDGRGLGMLDSYRLSELISKSRKIVSRSGYTTLMDLTLYPEAEVYLSPTPGQPEQEYLYHYHIKKGNYHSIDELK